jgi:hypothetical protein
MAKPGKTKFVAAVMGAGAVLAMGAVTLAAHDTHAGPDVVAAGAMQVGATSTVATPPTQPETSVAVPLVKAKPYGG